MFEDFKSHVTENFDRHITERSTSPANNKRQRLDHSTTSRNYAYWYCPECNSLFRGFFAYDIEAHMAKRHPEADYHHLAFKYSCGFSDCKYVNLGFSELQKHLLIAHKDSFLYKMPSAYSRVHSHWFCKDCNKGYKDALVIQIDQHLKTHGKGHLTNDFLYRCANKHCTDTPRTFTKIKQHIQGNPTLHPQRHHHYEPLASYALWFCNYCKKEYENFTGYDVEKHLDQEHHITRSDPQAFRYICRSCPPNSTSSNMNLYELEMHHQSDHLSYLCFIKPCITPIKQTPQSLINHLREAHLRWRSSWCDFENECEWLVNEHIKTDHPLPFMRVKTMPGGNPPSTSADNVSEHDPEPDHSPQSGCPYCFKVISDEQLVEHIEHCYSKTLTPNE